MKGWCRSEVVTVNLCVRERQGRLLPVRICVSSRVLVPIRSWRFRHKLPFSNVPFPKGDTPMLTLIRMERLR